MSTQKLPLKFHVVLAGVFTFVSTLSAQSKVDAFSIVAEIPNSVTGKSVSSILAADGRFQNVGIASLDPSPTLSVDNTVAFSISSNKTALPISEPGVLGFFDQLDKFVGNELQIRSFTDRVFFGLVDPDQNNRYDIFLNGALLFKDKQFRVGNDSGIVVFQIEPSETVRVITSIPSNGYLGDDGLAAVALAPIPTQSVPEPSPEAGLPLLVMGMGWLLKRKMK
jgi:hypothetical protein